MNRLKPPNDLLRGTVEALPDAMSENISRAVADAVREHHAQKMEKLPGTDAVGTGVPPQRFQVARRRPFGTIVATCGAIAMAVALTLGAVALSSGTSLPITEVLGAALMIGLAVFGIAMLVVLPIYFLLCPQSWWSDGVRLFSDKLPQEGVAIKDLQVRHVYQFFLIVPIQRYVELHYRDRANRKSASGMNVWFYPRADLDRVLLLVARAKS